MTTRDGAPTEKEIQEAHRSLGRYVYEFSRLIWHMRTTTASAVGSGQITGLSLGEIVLSEATASQITNAFFAVCEHLGRFDAGERSIGRRLRACVIKEYELRNELLHGDWFIGFKVMHADGEPAERSSTPRLSRPRPKIGPPETKVYGPEELDGFSDRVV